MTKLDESDGDGGENINLEALKSLAYEGIQMKLLPISRTKGMIVTNTRNTRMLLFTTPRVSRLIAKFLPLTLPYI